MFPLLGVFAGLNVVVGVLKEVPNVTDVVDAGLAPKLKAVDDVLEGEPLFPEPVLDCD